MTEPAALYAGWKITGQQETRQPDPSLGFVDGVNVMFTTTNGHTGSVFVPATLYTIDNVRTQVARKAELMDSIGSLNPGGLS